MAGLGSLRKLTGALQAASEATRVEKPAQRMSEALNPHVGKRLYVTQADRTALDYDQGLLGGPGFVELATIDPDKYKDIAWAVGKPGIAKTIVNSMAQHPEEAIWSNIIGSPTQHKSNQVVFDRLMNKFHNAIQEDKLTPELHKTINDRLANMKDPDTGKALFPKDVDIAHPDFKEHAQTFNTRALISDILSGKGVGGEKGTIIDFPKEIAETTDPYLLNANTGDIGDRLFSLSGNIEHRPELHPAFPSALRGRKESEAFMPAPSELVLQDYLPTFHQKILDKNAKLGENKPLRDPTYYDLTRGYAPSVPVTDQMLERLYKKGHKDGGEIHHVLEIKKLDSIPKLAEGNLISNAMKGYSKSAEFLKNLGIAGYNEAKEEIPTLLHPRAIPDVVANVGASIAGIPSDIMNLVIPPLNEEEVLNYKPALGSEDLQERLKQSGITTGTERPLIEGIATLASPRGIAKTGKSLVKEVGKQIETGTGIIGRNVMNPRMNIIKDQGGMLVGGEKSLDNELINMKRREQTYDREPYLNALGHRMLENPQPDPNAVAFNKWVDTKVRKYLRNQAGSEADPILKTIESGVEHNFQPTMGDTKYSVRNKRLKVGKPEAGIAKTELGKEFEYKIDSIFDAKSSKEVKEILNRPVEFTDPKTAERYRASLLRTEQDLPIQNEKDVEALRLLNEIPDENVYTLSGTKITDRLGLNHVSDVLMEDLQTGKLRPEQLSQMSIEKAIRRTAEYDAQKAKEMAKANAQSIEGMPISKQYNDGFKWVELKHETDPTKTKSALKSEGEMMGHCVGNYCPEVESGEIKIFSLRSPDGKSHATIEARPQFSMTLWRNANLDAINNNPKLKQYDFNMNSLDNDHKYGYRMTERDYVTEMTKEMKKLGINPVEPPSYMELHQVKGKQNKRPDEKYQNYISDFIKNNPTKHEIVDVKELDNTNLMNVQDIADTGLVNKDIHIHPEVQKALKIKYPAFNNLMAADKEDMAYDLFKETARDLARQNKTFLDKDDILNHIREKYLPPKKAKGGPIDLETEFKIRRRYG